jgi:hypothetical protein
MLPEKDAKRGRESSSALRRTGRVFPPLFRPFVGFRRAVGRVVAHHTSEVRPSWCWPEGRSMPALRPHRDFPRFVGAENFVLGAAHLRLQ